MQDNPIHDHPLVLAEVLLRQLESDTSAMLVAYHQPSGQIPKRLARLHELGRRLVVVASATLDRIEEQLPPRTDPPRQRQRLHPERPTRRR